MVTAAAIALRAACSGLANNRIHTRLRQTCPVRNPPGPVEGSERGGHPEAR